MQPIIYDVAVSIDGFISGPAGDVTQFAQSGPVVDDYLARLESYTTAIMGRKTYEFGYRFGLQPGQNPYEKMRTHVFSKTLELPANRELTLQTESNRSLVAALKEESEGPIYLCGGGEFAGALLEMGLIDVLRLKRAPIVLGGGVRLFGASRVSPDLQLTDFRPYDGGYLFQEFSIVQ